MFFQYLLLVVSLTSFLRDFHISCCDEDCADTPVFTPSRLVVKYGDPTSASCSVCQHCQTDASGLEVPLGVRKENGTTHTWTVDRLTEFTPSVLCYYNDGSGNTSRQCCTTLPVTVYQPPDSVSIHFASPMFEGHQETLNCDVSNVAPVENLTVTFYRGQTPLVQTQFIKTEKKPVSDLFNLTITPSKEDDEGQFWCEAKLELGPEGPQPPPVVRSESVTATVHYKPQLVVSSQPHQIVITEGDPLQLNCTAVGNPTPSYNWTVPSGGFSLTSSSILSIKAVTTEDKGEYTCLVSNSMGTVTVVYHVDVTVSYTGLITAVVITVLLLVFIGGICYYRKKQMG